MPRFQACPPVDGETKPELPLHEAPCSSSIILDLGYEQEWSFPASYIRTKLRSCPSPRLSRISRRPNCTGTFQCRSNNEHAIPRDRSSDESGRGSRSSGSGCLAVVVVVLLFALLGRWVVRRSTGRRWFSVFRSRVTSPRTFTSPLRSARRVLLRCWPSVIPRLAPGVCSVISGIRERNRGFEGIAPARLVLFNSAF